MVLTEVFRRLLPVVIFYLAIFSSLKTKPIYKVANFIHTKILPFLFFISALINRCFFSVNKGYCKKPTSCKYCESQYLQDMAALLYFALKNFYLEIRTINAPTRLSTDFINECKFEAAIVIAGNFEGGNINIVTKA